VWALTRVGRVGFREVDESTAAVSSVTRIGARLFDPVDGHAFSFEVTSILILVAMVGAVVLARREH
jgi:NADH:ubiquinone oxidoreductase subunit 6 (subunit J)